MFPSALPKPFDGETISIREVGNLKVYVHASDIMASVEMESPSSIDNLARLIEPAATRGLPIVFIDVGCNYGVQLCFLTRYIKNVAKNYKIFALDPGVASGLVPYTLWKNGLENDVEFIPAAAWKERTCVEVYSDKGNSLNNNVVGLPGQSITWIATAITIADLLNEADCPADTPIFAKIDTQGADVEVILGAGDYLRRMAFITEFTPWACGARHDLPAFLSSLRRTHLLFDLGHMRSKKVVIDDIGAFLQRVYEVAPYWTDILCVPLRFPYLIDSARDEIP